MTNGTHDGLARLCKRFEIAAGNFGRSCIAMRANEKAFQAWYAACVIQEFGLSRVYREVHLWKEELFALAGTSPLTEALKEGNELFPDLSISWQPDIDARHSSTREELHKKAGEMLKQFGILSELKVTGSTGKATGPRAIRQDLAKLAVFAAAHRASTAGEGNGLATYMVVLDNFCDGHGAACPHYEKERMNEVMKSVATEWPNGVLKPVVLLLLPQNGAAITTVYREFQEEEA